MERLPRRAPRRARGTPPPTATRSGRRPSRGAPGHPTAGGRRTPRRLPQLARERLGGGVVEQEPGLRRDGVGEAAGAADDRHRAVPHRDQLADPARLEPARHAEDVRTAVDLLREADVERDPRRDPRRMRRGEGPEAVLETRVAGPEHDQRAARVERRRGRREQQVEPLLVEQPRHHADHRAVAGLDAVQRAQRPARHGARGRIVGGERLGHRVVGGRVEPLGIDPVHDPDQVVLGEQALEAVAELGAGDLPRVGGADGGDGGGGGDAATEQVHGLGAVVARHRRWREPVAGRELGRLVALVGEVVDGQDRPPAVGQDRRQRAVPVVRVDDVGAPVVRDREPGSRQQGEPVAVVRLAVDRRAVEQFRALDQIDLDPVEIAAVHVHLVAAEAAGDAVPGAADVGAAVAGRHDPAVDAKRRERDRQRAGDVGEPADLRVRRRLGGDVEDTQGHGGIYRSVSACVTVDPLGRSASVKSPGSTSGSIRQLRPIRTP